MPWACLSATLTLNGSAYTAGSNLTFQFNTVAPNALAYAPLSQSSVDSLLHTNASLGLHYSGVWIAGDVLVVTVSNPSTATLRRNHTVFQFNWTALGVVIPPGFPLLSPPLSGYVPLSGMCVT